MTESISDNRTLTLGHLVDQAGLAYMETDRELCIRYWNKGAETMFGYSKDHVMGRHLDSVIPIENRVMCRLKDDEGACLARLENNTRHMQCRIRFTPIVDASGRKTGVALLVKDLIETGSRDQAWFNAGDGAMSNILGFAPIGIFHVSADGMLAMANPEYAWMMGYESPDQMVGQIHDFAGQVFYDGEKAESFMFLLMEAERVTRFRCRLKRRDGTFLWALCYAMLTRDDTGRMNGFNGYAIDIGDTIRVENALKKANGELMRLSLVDGLTQIANRRRFDDHLAASWQRHTREQKPMAVILCDIDHFKKFNDTYGHQAGDECLTLVAGAIDACARQSGGMAARYGGEEFGIILPETGLSRATAVAEKIRKKVLALAIVHEQSKTASRVTLSLGVTSTIPREDLSDMGFLARADSALYNAKNQGRNQVRTVSG
ncbi:MAG: diguanylate cyclase [Desulfobacter sp.]